MFSHSKNLVTNWKYPEIRSLWTGWRRWRARKYTFMNLRALWVSRYEDLEAWPWIRIETPGGGCSTNPNKRMHCTVPVGGLFERDATWIPSRESFLWKDNLTLWASGISSTGPKILNPNHPNNSCRLNYPREQKFSYHFQISTRLVKI